MESIIVKPEDQADPVALRNEDGLMEEMVHGPDPLARWGEFRFSTVKPWLPMGDRSEEETVDSQGFDQGSTLLNIRNYFNFGQSG